MKLSEPNHDSGLFEKGGGSVTFVTMKRESYTGPGVAEAICDKIAQAVIDRRKVARIRLGRVAADALSAEFTALDSFGAQFEWTDKSTFRGYSISRDAPEPGDVIVELA